MANANLEVTLDSLHDAIRAQVAAQFPSFRTVEFYRDDEDMEFPVPACIMEMSEAEPNPDGNAGTEQFPCLLRFEARIIMQHRDASTPLSIRKAATALAAWLDRRRFTGIQTDPCQVIAVEPDAFTTEQKGFTVWRVEWVMPSHLGENVWLDEGPAVGEVLYSFTPKIGAAHEGDYKSFTDGVAP